MSFKDNITTPLSPYDSFGPAYAAGMLIACAYSNSAVYTTRWGQIMHPDAVGIIETPDILTPNFAYAVFGDVMLIALPGTTAVWQMFQNIIYAGQRQDPNLSVGCQVHSFFLWAAQGMAPHIAAHLANYPAVTKVCWCGHSLGGSVAEILADASLPVFGKTPTLCMTFNKPRSGNATWANLARNYRTYMYYGSSDLVCELPPPWIICETDYPLSNPLVTNYRHRGEVFELNWRGGTSYSVAGPHGGYLIRIESSTNIKASWKSIEFAKSFELAAFTDRVVTGFGIAQSFSRMAGILGLCSWVFPVPVWVEEHGIMNILKEMDDA